MLVEEISGERTRLDTHAELLRWGARPSCASCCHRQPRAARHRLAISSVGSGSISSSTSRRSGSPVCGLLVTLLSPRHFIPALISPPLDAPESGMNEPMARFAIFNAVGALGVAVAADVVLVF